MKRLIVLSTLALLTACSKPAETDVTLSKAPIFRKGEVSPFELQLKHGESPATGYTVTTNFSMARMDHGHMQVELKETSPGTYAGEVALPMGGEWDIDVSATKDGQTSEKPLSVKVSDGS